jgi:restriction endonuclease Mrr
MALMNGEQLVRLLVEHQIGVRRASYELIELVDEGEADKDLLSAENAVLSDP